MAVKLEPKTSKLPQLEREFHVYKALAGGCGIPQVYHYTNEETDYNVMVMDLLGPSLEDLFNCCNRVFSLKTVLLIAIQSLHRLEFVHSKKYITRDVKPENFLLGIGKNQNTIYMIDYGLAKKYVDNNMQHVPYVDGKSLTGTVRYASINTHIGIIPSRRDDLESLGYMLIYFLRGKLPWQGIQAINKEAKYQKIAQAKITASPAKLVEGFPREFCVYLEYCRSLKYNEVPDYRYLRKLFIDLFCQDLKPNWDWDWKSISLNKVHEKQVDMASPTSDPWFNAGQMGFSTESAAGWPTTSLNQSTTSNYSNVGSMSNEKEMEVRNNTNDNGTSPQSQPSPQNLSQNTPHNTNMNSKNTSYYNNKPQKLNRYQKKERVYVRTGGVT